MNTILINVTSLCIFSSYQKNENSTSKNQIPIKGQVCLSNLLDTKIVEIDNDVI